MIVAKDLYDIGDRLKEIAPYYFVVYNQKNGKYELHSHLERPTYVLTFPYEKLDQRAIEHTIKTRVENIEKTIAEIEKHNLKLEQDAVSDGIKKAQNMIDKVASDVL